jgi:hypothetical protein
MVAVTGGSSTATSTTSVTAAPSATAEPTEDAFVEAWAETVAQAIAVPKVRAKPKAAVPPPIVVVSGSESAAVEHEPAATDTSIPAGQLTMTAAIEPEPEPQPVLAYLLPDPPEPPASPWPPAPRPAIATAATASLLPDEPVDANPSGPFPDWVNEPVLEPRPYASATTRTTTNGHVATPALATPAAYRPPTMTMAAAATAGVASGPWPGASTPEAAPDEPVSRRQWSVPAITLDPARATELATWFIIVGATLGLLGFLLPWSRVVIGSGVYGDYFASWGLAGPRHVFVVLGLMAMLALAVLQTRVPAWVSSGVLGLVGGALLIGMVWPYLIGPLGADVGVLVTALGGVALIAGGSIAVWSRHHAEAVPGV